MWSQLPATSMLLYAALTLLRIDVVMLLSCHTADERDHIIEQSNHEPDRAMVHLDSKKSAGSYHGSSNGAGPTIPTSSFSPFDRVL